MVKMIIDSILDMIPWWGWVVIVGTPIGVLLYFFGPILLPIWRMLPLWLRAVILGVGAAFIAWMGGRHVGAENEKEKERRRNAEALGKRTEVDREIGSLNAGEAEKRLRDRWGSDGT
jgi:hypothetical protein